MSFTLTDGYEVYLDSICECTFCPPNTKQCAHLDGYWVRLTKPPLTSTGSKPRSLDTAICAVSWNFRLHPRAFMCTDFYHPPLTLADAKDDFHRLNGEMRKIAREEN